MEPKSLRIFDTTGSYTDAAEWTSGIFIRAMRDDTSPFLSVVSARNGATITIMKSQIVRAEEYKD